MNRASCHFYWGDLNPMVAIGRKDHISAAIAIRGFKFVRKLTGAVPKLTETVAFIYLKKRLRLLHLSS